MSGGADGGASGTSAAGRIVVPLLLVAQLGVPAMAAVLASAWERPVRFGFQMYSGRGEMPVVKVSDARGLLTTVPPQRFAAATRSEVDWARHVPPHLCAKVPDLEAVHVVYRKTPERSRVVPCER